MLGKWDRWYAGLTEPAAYGDTITYQRGADWLRGLHVEDWGCGKGWLRQFIPADLYRGIDGSHSPFVDEIADLRTYRSQTEGVFLRHVLEHNTEWQAVLDNALASATQRLFLAIFTPMAATTTHQCGQSDDLGVPDISFAIGDLADRIEAAGFDWTADTFATNTQYGEETVLECER